MYVALNKCAWPESRRLRWLLAYISFYHCGSACYISAFEGAAFWSMLRRAAINVEPSPAGGRWPRGHERRHFRGAQALSAVEAWADRYAHPEDWFRYVIAGGSRFADVSARAREHKSVGAWLSFKVVDLVDACCDNEVDQSDATVFLYETPRQSLLRVWLERHAGAQPSDELAAAAQVLAGLREELRDCTVPHKPGKPIDLFCLETCACKHGSHVTGHYPLFNDIDEIRVGLEPWVAHAPGAQDFAAAMPAR